MFIKLIGISDLREHNQAQKAGIEVIHTGIKNSRGFSGDMSSSILERRMIIIREFKVSKQNVEVLSETINQEIDVLSNQFKKIFVNYEGSITNGIGEITVWLSIARS